MKTAICLFVCLLFSCEQRDESGQLLDDIEQQRVVISALHKIYEKYVEKGVALVVVDEFHLDPYFRDRSVLEEAILRDDRISVDAELLNDFFEKNSNVEGVWDSLADKENMILVGPDEISALYKQKNLISGKTGVERFQVKFPESPGAITLSKVGFNKKRDKAMLCIGTPNGPGTIFVLHKQGGLWVLQYSQSISSGWVS